MLALLIIGIVVFLGGVAMLIIGIIENSDGIAMGLSFLMGSTLGPGGIWMIIGGALILFGLAAIIVGSVNLKKRKAAGNQNSGNYNQFNQINNQYNQMGSGSDVSATTVLNNLPCGYIKILTGSMAGMCVPISDGERFMLGKDKSTCNIIFSNDYMNVSRSHCEITYNASPKMYAVTDYSSNGTYYKDGSRLPKGIRTNVHSGTVIMLANSNCLVELS